MNMAALATMLGIGLLVAGVMGYALLAGHPVLLAVTVCALVAMFVRWG